MRVGFFWGKVRGLGVELEGPFFKTASYWPQQTLHNGFDTRTSDSHPDIRQYSAYQEQTMNQ